MILLWSIYVFAKQINLSIRLNLNEPATTGTYPSIKWGTPSAIAAMISHVNVTNGTLSSWCDSTVFQVEFYFVCLLDRFQFLFFSKIFLKNNTFL